jgi:hypothetical protein
LEFEVGGKDEAHKKKIESVVGNLRISLLQVTASIKFVFSIKNKLT